MAGSVPNMNAVPASAADDLVLDDPLEQARYSSPVVEPDGRQVTESALQVSGMTCAACASIIEAALMRVEGVSQARVSAASQRASVRWDPARTRPSALIAAVRAAGYEAAPDAAAPARELRRAEQRQALWRFFVAALCAMQVMMLATPGYVAGAGEMAPDLRQLLNWGGWVLSLPVLLFAAGPFFGGAWHALRRRRIGMDVPVALGLTVAFVASTGATFAPGGWFGHEVYFDSLTMFVSFLLGARYLEMRTRHGAALQLEGTMSLMPPSAWREGDAGRVERISVQRLQPGDVVRVPLGEAFPADGPLLAGRTQADEALLSGESTPVSKQAGDMLVAGSRNVGGPVRQRVERVGADTRLERIVALMRQAATQRPEAARLADRWAGPFLWAVLVLAAGTAAAWSLFDPARALPAAVAVLIVTCPCALSLAVPSTLVAAAGGLARRGVLLQRLEALDALARFDHLLIDKTGTLTTDQLQLGTVRVAPQAILAEPALRAVAAALARWSSHPVALALQSAAEAGVALSEVQEQPGVGLGGRDDAGRRWTLTQVPAGAPAWVGAARSLLCADGVPQAAFDLDEVLRPGAGEALAQLRSEGVQLTLLSGDARGRVRAIAQRLGLGEWQAGATPDDKLAAAAEAQRAGHCVGMVGDGVNDGPVLARADLSLAMGQGALVARAQADAVVMSGDWGDLLRARATARRSLRIVQQNLVWAAAYNAVGIPLAVLGWLPPWAAGLGMALSSLAVVANSSRAARLPQ